MTDRVAAIADASLLGKELIGSSSPKRLSAAAGVCAMLRTVSPNVSWLCNSYYSFLLNFKMNTGKQKYYEKHIVRCTDSTPAFIHKKNQEASECFTRTFPGADAKLTFLVGIMSVTARGLEG